MNATVNETRSSQSWLIQIAVFGAATAGFLFFLRRHFLTAKTEENQDRMKRLCAELEKVKGNWQDSSNELKAGFDSARENFNMRIAEATSEIKNYVLSQELQDSLDTVKSVLENLKAFDEESENYHTSVVLLLALIKKIQDKMGREDEGAGEERKVTREGNRHLTQARRYGGYAVSIYSASWSLSHSSAAKTMGVPPEEIILSWFSDEEGVICPKFILFRDKDVESIVLAIRGTFSIKDVVLDIVCEEREFLGGFAHKGILEGARNIITKIQEKLKTALEENRNYKLVITGHSLGAATAELILLDLTLGEAAKHIPPGTLMECIALAPPPVFRSDTGLPARIRSAVRIYINNNDIVPRLSLASVAGLLAMVRQVDNLNLSLSTVLAVLTDRGEEATLHRIREAIKQGKQEKFPFLEHPGQIFHVRRSGQAWRLFPGDSSTFTKMLLLLDNMVADHLHNQYQIALDNIDSTLP